MIGQSNITLVLASSTARENCLRSCTQLKSTLREINGVKNHPTLPNRGSDLCFCDGLQWGKVERQTKEDMKKRVGEEGERKELELTRHSELETHRQDGQNWHQ